MSSFDSFFMSRASSKLRFAVVWLLSLLPVTLMLVAFLSGLFHTELGLTQVVFREGNYNLFSPHRKLLSRSLAVEEPNRIGGERCTKADIVINQGPTAPLPNGIPTYTVEIMNACVTGCDIAGIHLNCGWFSSARLINPKIFKRLHYNDCLVNDGKPLINGGTLSFDITVERKELTREGS